jgi:hypothetical protein
MNWYKKSQKLEIEETHKYDSRNYTDYGHDIYNEEETVNEEDYKSNYMWEYRDGEIDIEEETGDTPAHAYVARWESPTSHIGFSGYSGRYEGGRGVITVTKPYKGVARHRDVPSILQYKLRKAFPEAKKILVF